MDLNRIMTLVLGFIILILLFVWISSRFRANTKTAQIAIVPTVTSTPTPQSKKGWSIFSLFQKATPTPAFKTTKGGVVITSLTPTPTLTPTGMTTMNQNPQVTIVIPPNPKSDVVYRNYTTGKVSRVNEIPDTGAPTIVMTLALAALSGGIYLRKKI